MAYKWILYDGAKNQMEIWSTKLDINIVVTTNFYMKESPHSNVVYKCTNHLGFLGCIFKSARWILQLWNHRQPWRETLLRHFITCMHLIKRLKRLLKPSKPLGFSWLQFVFSTFVHTCAQPRKWVFKITSVAGRGLHWGVSWSATWTLRWRPLRPRALRPAASFRWRRTARRRGWPDLGCSEIDDIPWCTYETRWVSIVVLNYHRLLGQFCWGETGGAPFLCSRANGCVDCLGLFKYGGEPLNDSYRVYSWIYVIDITIWLRS